MQLCLHILEQMDKQNSLHGTVLRTIIALNVPTIGWDSILIHIVEEKLDSHTLSCQELAITNPTSRQSLKQMQEHLERQITIQVTQQ